MLVTYSVSYRQIDSATSDIVCFLMLWLLLGIVGLMLLTACINGLLNTHPHFVSRVKKRSMGSERFSDFEGFVANPEPAKGHRKDRCLVLARAVSFLEVLPSLLQIARWHIRRGRPTVVRIFLFASQGEHGIRTGCASGRRRGGCECQQQHGDRGECKHTRIEWTHFK